MAVDIALHQRDTAGPGLPVVDVLARTSPSTAAFWTDAAAELHRRNLHFDAFDCWTKAIEVEREAVDFADMAKTLWNISGGEGFFAEEALRVYESIRAWQDVAYLRFRLRQSKPEVLQAIEHALAAAKVDLDWDDYWGFVEFENIWDWTALGHYYLECHNPAKAVWAFANSMATHPTNAELLKTVAVALSDYVTSQGAAGVA